MQCHHYYYCLSCCFFLKHIGDKSPLKNLLILNFLHKNAAISMQQRSNFAKELFMVLFKVLVSLSSKFQYSLQVKFHSVPE